ncbi:unnamed protein product, partial [Darwinula stevensoni]
NIAPVAYQETYDNAGLIVGNAYTDLTGVLVCLDSIENVVDEAIAKNCNLIIAHHPIIFKGLKRLNGKNYVERTVIKAIKHDIAIYAIHTNLDNVYENGVNTKIAEKLGLKNTHILSPRQGLRKLSVLVGATQAEQVKKAMFEAGAAIAHNIVAIENNHHTVGAGLIGSLEQAVEEQDFLYFLKNTMKTGCVRHTHFLEKKIQKVAICGGSGGFLLSQAIAQGADIFITADYKYHEFFDADGQILIADIGHYESEQFTIELIAEIISKKF